jgi:N-acetylmuramic acid 6-phosphate etherase
VTQLDQLGTERPNPRTVDIDRLDTLGILQRLNDEDQLVATAVRAALPQVAEAVDVAFERWRRGGRVVLFGAGTSGRLAMLDAAELGPTFGVQPDRYLARMAGGPEAFLKAVEGAEDDTSAGAEAVSDLTALDIAFGIAASGRTPWVVGALQAARARGAATIGLACVPGAALAGHVDIMIVIDTGAEPISGSTRMKAGTAQKLVLNAFSSTLMIRLGKVFSNLMVDVQVTNEKLRRRAVRLVEQAADVDTATAQSTLGRAGGDVKTAIAMLRLGVSADAARQALDAAEGYLRRVIDADPAHLATNRPAG